MAAGFPEIEPAPPPRAYPVLAWLVILATVVFIVTLRRDRARRQEAWSRSRPISRYAP